MALFFSIGPVSSSIGGSAFANGVLLASKKGIEKREICSQVESRRAEFEPEGERELRLNLLARGTERLRHRCLIGSRATARKAS